MQRNTVIWVLLCLTGCNIILVAYSQLLVSFEIHFHILSGSSFLPAGLVGDHSTFRYNLWRGAKELYKANLHLLAILVVVWSGIYPYIKLLALTITLLNSQTRRHSRKHHPQKQTLSHKFAHVLTHTLGKWGLLDVCVVCCVVCCVSVECAFGSVQGRACLGCYVFCAAIVASQILGHAVHYVTTHHANPDDDDITNTNNNNHSTQLTLPIHAEDDDDDPNNKNNSNFFLGNNSPHTCTSTWHVFGASTAVVVSSVVLVASHCWLCVLYVRCEYSTFIANLPLGGKQMTLVQMWRFMLVEADLDFSNRTLCALCVLCTTIVPVLHVCVMAGACLWIALFFAFPGSYRFPNASSTESWVRMWKKMLLFCSRWSLLDVFSLALVLLTMQLSHIAKSLSHNLIITTTRPPPSQTNSLASSLLSSLIGATQQSSPQISPASTGNDDDDYPQRRGLILLFVAVCVLELTDVYVRKVLESHVLVRNRRRLEFVDKQTVVGAGGGGDVSERALLIDPAAADDEVVDN